MMKIIGFGGIICAVIILLSVLFPPLKNNIEDTLTSIFYIGFICAICCFAMLFKAPEYNHLFKNPHMRLSTANFHYTVEHYGNIQYIAIVDFGGVNKSVTNDIENVVADIQKWERITSWHNIIIIYQDSDGIWEGWDPVNQDFVHLEDDNSLDAVKHYLTLTQEQQANDNEIYERIG